ncbi:Oidioi.mRNA.OKI2018_I69.chr2.g5122.t1.cds [Oikopleura dioica]|uniref:Oidioi.mRNA.OKI2018_I69.chr2.g5122.t1.cds n=1 Tax=Oikopleura dioica TaxID=34765 RepID=A0ABN7T613_OIKDI|nr:Oidioi.mRNA.OKI2018_I69.chr2.g5122.t1.cds [Oikopleura dioica]
MEQRHVIHFLQEIFIKALMSKARAEGKGRKFFKLFNSILSLREVVNEADVNQVYRYNRRILPNDNFKGDGGSSGSSPSPNNGDGSSGFNGYDGGSNFRAHRMDSRMLHMR